MRVLVTSPSSSKLKCAKELRDPGDEVSGVSIGKVTVPTAPVVGEREGAVWRQWLASMANDAEAALAAAVAYREMDSRGREGWLASLCQDAPLVDVPAVALYAPLLAVEEDPERRRRLLLAMSECDDRTSRHESSALVGKAEDGTRVFVISTHLYLNFFQTLACGVLRGRFSWVRHDPIVGAMGIPKVGDCLESARLERGPLRAALDELAVAVLSHQRGGESLPEALGVLGDLLDVVESR